MKVSKSIRSIAILVVFGILTNWCFFSQDSAAAEAQKAPVTQQKSPAMSAPQAIKYCQQIIIEGKVMYGTKAMDHVELILKEYFKNGRQGTAGKQTTHSDGEYKFTLKFNDDIAKYTIVPKHPVLSPGDNFSPQEKEIPVACGTTKIDFTYTGPLPDLVPVSAVMNGITAIIKIKNQGGLGAEPFKVWVRYECPAPYGQYVSQTYSVPGLGAGATKDLTDSEAPCHITNPFNNSTASTPAKSIKSVHIDPYMYDDVFESDNTNNKLYVH